MNCDRKLFIVNKDMKNERSTYITRFLESREALENTCQLACVKKEDIIELLTSTLINPQNTRYRHTVCRRNLNSVDACRYRLHSIIRYLYDLLFHWLINFLNEILSARLYSERLGIKNVFLTRFKQTRKFCCSLL